MGAEDEDRMEKRCCHGASIAEAWGRRNIPGGEIFGYLWEPGIESREILEDLGRGP